MSKAKNPKGLVIDASDTHALAIKGLRSMGVTSDAIAERILKGQTVRNRADPAREPFILKAFKLHLTFNNGNWHARVSGNSKTSVELHNIIA